MTGQTTRTPLAGIAIIAVLLVPATLWAKDFWAEKPYTKWNKKETTKVLNDSPWADTFTFTDQTQGVYEPTPRTAEPGEGRDNREIYRYFRVRFLTAKPIRMAFSRMNTIMNDGEKTEGVDPQAEAFVNSNFGDRIVVAIDADANEPRYRGQMMQLMANLTLGQLQNNTYLQRKTGEKNYLVDYVPPGRDGLGAKLVFSRTLDGEPFISEKTEVFRFVTELASQFRLNIPFRVDKMAFDGKLEY